MLLEDFRLVGRCCSSCLTQRPRYLQHREQHVWNSLRRHGGASCQTDSASSAKRAIRQGPQIVGSAETSADLPLWEPSTSAPDNNQEEGWSMLGSQHSPPNDLTVDGFAFLGEETQTQGPTQLSQLRPTHEAAPWARRVAGRCQVRALRCCTSEHTRPDRPQDTHTSSLARPPTVA